MGNLSSDNCPICGGSGFVHPKYEGKTVFNHVVPCKCQKERLEKERIEFLLRTCELPPHAEDMTFENYKPNPNSQNAFNMAKLMSNKPGEPMWLTLIGNNGVGKTHLAICICRAWVKAGIPARYTLVSLLLDELRSGFQNTDPENSYDGKFNYYKNIPLLLLDDYGAESKTPWVQEKMDALIDYRLMHELSLIVTSNWSLDDMPPRIKSRLIRPKNKAIIEVGGEDYKLRGK